VKELITDEIGEELYRLAREVHPDRAIVELGSFEGKSTSYLARGAEDQGYVLGNQPVQVYAVDLWDDPRNELGKHRYRDTIHIRRFTENIMRLELKVPVIAMQMVSWEAAQRYDGPLVGLLYVDADHREESVRRDVNAWRRHLAPGAVLAFDDWGTKRNPGVRVVVDELGYPYSVVAERLAIVRLP
jgi:hypothetical protein